MRYIYLIRNLLDQKTYVGQTGDLRMRWYSHQSGARTNKDHLLYRAMRLYGIENFSFEMIEECDDSHVNEREAFWISHHQSTDRNFGYNLLLGNLVFHRHTDESKAKISAAMKNRYFSPQHRKRLSRSSKGRKHTLEAKQKMSAAKLGKCPRDLPEIQAKRWSSEGNPRATTTYEIAKQIRDHHATTNESIASIARQFSLSYKTVYGIIRGSSYSVPGGG